MDLTKKLHLEMLLPVQKIGHIPCISEQPHRLVSLIRVESSFPYYLLGITLYQSMLFPGAIPTEGIPSLLKVVLPANCTGLPLL